MHNFLGLVEYIVGQGGKGCLRWRWWWLKGDGEGRTLGQEGARHSTTNRMHRQYILFLVSSCIKKSYSVYFPSPLYKQSSQPTLPSAPYHNVRSTQYCNSTKWLELDLNASEVREVPSAWCPVWGAQCGMPSVGCPVWDAQCKVPSVWCPVPSQGSLLDPRSQAQKGRLVRKARPSQAAGLPHFARVRTGLFPFIFLFQDLSCQLLYFNSSPDSEFLSQNSPV